MSEMGQPRKPRLQFTIRAFMYGVALLVVATLSGRELYFWATSSPLDEAVAAFNFKFTPDSEAPLTDDEIIASIGSQIAELDEPVRSIYARIARTRRLPKGADLRLITGRGERRRRVNLEVMTGENSGYGLRVRGHDEKFVEGRELSLRNRDITGEELPKLLEGYPELRSLDLSYNLLADEDLDHLHALEMLEVINLEHTDISDAGLMSLTHLPNLKKVYLYRGPGHRTTDAGRRMLREVFPELKMLFITH